MILNHSFSVDQIYFLVRLLIFFFPLRPKSSRLKSKSFISFFIQYIFDLADTQWHCFYRRDWSNQFELHLQHDTMPLQHGYMFLPYHTLTIAGSDFCCLLKYIQSLWKGSFIDWGFVHSSLMIQHLLPERLRYCKGWNHPDL